MGQIKLNLFKGKRGGRRPGSGRRRIHSKGVSHRIRETIHSRTPMHINFRYCTHIKNKTCLKLLKRAIINSRRHGLRIIHFSLQSNHVHLIVEAIDNKILTKGMRSLLVTFAKGLNKGRVQLERYHLHVLRSIRETRNAIHYVLFNQQRHEKGTYSKVDEFSSLLGMKNAIQIVRKYSGDKKMTLSLGKFKGIEMDLGRSFLIKQGENLC